MKANLEDFGCLYDRLVVLEKQNRRFKQLGFVGLIGVTLLLTMGQASKKTIEANELILKDDAGKVRARLSIDNQTDHSELQLYNEKGNLTVRLDSSRSMLFWDKQGMPTVALYGFDGVGRVELTDAEGFQATLGATNLVTPKTGETHKTSAASLVLFDKNQNVIWKAP